jgi:hypothetical protein
VKKSDTSTTVISHEGAGIWTIYGSSSDTLHAKNLQAGTGVTLTKNADSSITISSTSGNTNSNIGSGYRLAVPFTNNIKTIFAVSPLGIDSATNSNALTFTFDTSVIHTTAYNNSQYGSLSQQNTNTSNIASNTSNISSNTTAINTKIDSLKRSYDSVFFKINGTWIFAFRDNHTPALTTLTDGATITWDYTTQTREAKVTLAGNRTLSITNLPANKVVYLTLAVIQDATGSRTLTLPAGTKVINGGSGVVTLTTTANATDVLSFRWDGTTLFCTYGKNYN